MPKEPSLGIGYYLYSKNIKALIQYSDKYSIDHTTAINMIVQEWRTGKEMKPLTTKKEVNETILEEALKSIEERLNQIEGQLADAQVTIVKTE